MDWRSVLFHLDFPDLKNICQLDDPGIQKVCQDETFFEEYFRSLRLPVPPRPKLVDYYYDEYLKTSAVRQLVNRLIEMETQNPNDDDNGMQIRHLQKLDASIFRGLENYGQIEKFFEDVKQLDPDDAGWSRILFNTDTDESNKIRFWIEFNFIVPGPSMWFEVPINIDQLYSLISKIVNLRITLFENNKDGDVIEY